MAEADESDASFLHLQPMIAIVTNIDADHLATYGGEYAELERVFVEFLQHLPFYGLAVLCADDFGIQHVQDKINRPQITYGIEKPADIWADKIINQGTRTRFEVHFADKDMPLEVELNLPGRHNVLNALGAIAVAHELGVDGAAIQRALAGFQGIGRRFQVAGEIVTSAGQILLVDDYGHHPTEIAATLGAARAAWPTRRLVVAFQPHRFSRTRDLFEDFVNVLSEADALLLMEVYSAGEPPVPNADGRSLARAIRARGRVEPVFIGDIESLPTALLDVIEEGDVVLTLGAGSIGQVAQGLATALEVKR